MQYAHPTHKVDIYIISIFATDFFERDNPLTFSITRFSRVGWGLEGCRSFNKWWPVKIFIPIIWALWVWRGCSCAPNKPRKPIIKRIILQELLEMLFQCLSFVRSVVFSLSPPTPSFILHIFLRHLLFPAGWMRSTDVEKL
jgi:hypothetical protein